MEYKATAFNPADDPDTEYDESKDLVWKATLEPDRPPGTFTPVFDMQVRKGGSKCVRLEKGAKF